MIQFLADGIDQLDLALDQLVIEDRNFDRFALMLVDNVVELTLHQYARDRGSENKMWIVLKDPKYDPKPIDKALGQNFDNKVRLAAKLGLVDKTVSESILNLHAFRNTAYHRGLRHEGILHSLTLLYFRTTCELLKAYEPRFWSWGSSDVVSYRARKYLGDSPHRQPTESFRAAYVRLGELAAAMQTSLASDLGADMEVTVDTIDSAIQFLADDSPEKMTRDEVVVQSQAWAMAFTEEGKDFGRAHGCDEQTVRGYVDWLARHFAWPAKGDPIPSWRARVATLKSEADAHRALKKYCDFMRQTEEIRSTLTEAAAQLDGYIQEQIDRARGK
jgi:hypothetical protein